MRLPSLRVVYSRLVWRVGIVRFRSFFLLTVLRKSGIKTRDFGRTRMRITYATDTKVPLLLFCSKYFSTDGTSMRIGAHEK